MTASTATLATLIGSDKQVAWATDIRATLLSRIDAEVSSAFASWEGEEMPAHVAELVGRYTTLREQIAAETQAAVLIDARFLKVDEAVSKLAILRKAALQITPWAV